MSGTRRLQKEFKDLQSSGIIETESVKNLEIDSQSILQWSGKLNPTKVINYYGNFEIFLLENPFLIKKVKSHFEINVGKKRIRHITTLNLNLESILSRFRKSSVNFIVVVCRIRLFPTLILK